MLGVTRPRILNKSKTLSDVRRTVSRLDRSRDGGGRGRSRETRGKRRRSRWVSVPLNRLLCIECVLCWSDIFEVYTGHFDLRVGTEDGLAWE